MNASKLRHRRGRWLSAGAVGAAAVLALAACGKTTTAGGGSTSSPSPSGNADAAITISTAGIQGVGTVLVNGNGQTLYLLSSEQGGKITCTDANGCTKVWPDTELPSGKTAAIAGAGIQASLLGTVKTPDGKLYVTYNTFPLYTFTGDTRTGTAAGQGINSFGGVWTAITPAGDAPTPAPRPAPSSPAATPSKSASSSGYGY
jgi:predicted lipoprotein with Yx(FWY)xxD motif